MLAGKRGGDMKTFKRAVALAALGLTLGMSNAVNAAVHVITYSGTAFDFKTGEIVGPFNASTIFDTDLAVFFASGETSSQRYKQYFGQAPINFLINGEAFVVPTNLYNISIVDSIATGDDIFGIEAFSGDGNITTIISRKPANTINSADFPTWSADGVVGTLFTYSTTGNRNFAFDGTLSVSAIPEPATWAMMLLGFGAIGGVMRNRHRKQVRFKFN